MALDATKMERLAGGGNGMWRYTTADTIATVTGSGYFNAFTNNLRQWDTIVVVSETGGTAKVDMVAVTSASGAATVTTTATEGVTAT